MAGHPPAVICTTSRFPPPWFFMVTNRHFMTRVLLLLLSFVAPSVLTACYCYRKGKREVDQSLECSKIRDNSSRRLTLPISEIRATRQGGWKFLHLALGCHADFKRRNCSRQSDDLPIQNRYSTRSARSGSIGVRSLSRKRYIDPRRNGVQAFQVTEDKSYRHFCRRRFAPNKEGKASTVTYHGWSRPKGFYFRHP